MRLSSIFTCSKLIKRLKIKKRGCVTCQCVYRGRRVVRGNLPPTIVSIRLLVPVPMGTTRTTLPAAHRKVNGHEKLSKRPGIPRTTLQL